MPGDPLTMYRIAYRALFPCAHLLASRLANPGACHNDSGMCGDMPAGHTPFKNACNLTFPGTTTVLPCTNQ